jgi:hypothetical protein
MFDHPVNGSESTKRKLYSEENGKLAKRIIGLSFEMKLRLCWETSPLLYFLIFYSTKTSSHELSGQNVNWLALLVQKTLFELRSR